MARQGGGEAIFQGKMGEATLLDNRVRNRHWHWRSLSI